MTVRRKRKPPLDPEQNVWAVDGATVTLTPPGDSSEHGSETMVVPAMLLDAVNELEELTPVGWVSDDVAFWWPESRETVLNAHRLYARDLLERLAEAFVDVVDVPVCSQGPEPQWQSAHACCWVDDIAQGLNPPPVEPVQQRQDSLGGSRVVLIDSADHYTHSPYCDMDEDCTCKEDS
tara:strand:- start:664 stop:1197 length:534 start_codon:yes stop_codon:yes gene_type:complete